MSRAVRSRLSTCRGQAAVELVLAIPLVCIGALVGLQLLIAGHAQSLADGAAEAGALARAGGASPARAARVALPGWARSRASVRVRGARVEVALRPPAPLGSVAAALEVSSSAWVRSGPDAAP